MILRSFLVVAASVVLVSGCSKPVKAPTTPRTCYFAVEQKDETWKFHKVEDKVKSIEYCALALERMRLRFLQMGGSNREIVGSYQGQFIFMLEEGVFFSRKIDGVRYLALRRYGGKLVMPGAIREPPTPNKADEGGL